MLIGKKFGLKLNASLKEVNMVEADLLTLNMREVDNLLFKRSAASVSTVLDGETVILDVETGVYSGLNEVGTVLWDLLEGQTYFAGMCNAILADFNVTSDECSENILSFLKELQENKLIEVSVEANT